MTLADIQVTAPDFMRLRAIRVAAGYGGFDRHACDQSEPRGARPSVGRVTSVVLTLWCNLRTTLYSQNNVTKAPIRWADGRCAAGLRPFVPRGD